ncbi:hypothetical protein G6L37_06080 [Agrobacterium rubi]|nr:hypothetical protein [Agrobacterium rubi]NTF24929.1 hypothetical protein [Agrobacterium rubi]
MNFDDKTVSEIEEILTYGHCYPAALAMSEVLGWPIGGLIVIARRTNWTPHLVHAYLVAPDGRAFDANGFRNLDKVYEDFLGNRTEREFRNAEFVTYETSEEFRHVLRCLYDQCEVPTGMRTEYDDFLDEHLPGIKEAVTQRLDVVSRARDAFPELDDADWTETDEEWKARLRKDVEERFGPTPTDLVPAGAAGW